MWCKTNMLIGYDKNFMDIVYDVDSGYKVNRDNYPGNYVFSSMCELEEWVRKNCNSNFKLVSKLEHFMEVSKFSYKSVLGILPTMNYKVDKDDGECISAISVHKWDMEGNCALSVNGKRRISFRFDREDFVIYMSIKEDGGTRTVYNGVIETEEQLRLIDRLSLIL